MLHFAYVYHLRLGASVCKSENFKKSDYVNSVSRDGRACNGNFVEILSDLMILT
ncbi:protein of unknown function [Rhodovastum atsumiense]|nr:protein of unknown function [Rhodovastum atsumiense]